MQSLFTHKNLLAAALLLSVFSLSCTRGSDEEEKEPEEQKEQSGPKTADWENTDIDGNATMNEMAFYVTKGGILPQPQVSTRSTTDIDGVGSLVTGDLVSIAVTRSGVSEVVKTYRIMNDGSLEYTGTDDRPFVWENSSETVSIRAWSYGDNTTTSAAPETIEYCLEANQNTNGYKELYYCKAANHSYSSGAITLNFYHQLSRVIFNINHEKDGTLPVTSAFIGNSSFPKSANFVVPGSGENVGSWTVTNTSTGTITPKTETTQAGFEKTYSAVIFPNTTYAKNTQFFTVTNSDGNYVYKISANAGVTLSSGCQYNYTITVKDGDPGVELTNNSIQPGWVIADNSKAYETKAKAESYNHTPVALVYAVGSTASNNSSYTHGIAIGLADAGSGIQWKNSKNGVQCSFLSLYFDPCRGDRAGVAETATLVSHSSHGHSAAIIANNYTPVISNAKWFLPSFGQWCDFFNWCNGGTTVNTAWGWNNNTTSRTNVRDKLYAAGGDSAILSDAPAFYWTSTEGNTDRAAGVRFSSSQGIYIYDFIETEAHEVRPFLAF